MLFPTFPDRHKRLPIRFLLLTSLNLVPFDAVTMGGAGRFVRVLRIQSSSLSPTSLLVWGAQLLKPPLHVRLV